VRLLLVWVGAGSLLAWSGHAVAADADASPDAPPPPEKPSRVWLARAGVGLGFATQSQQEALVSAESFGGPRFHVSAEVARMLTERVGLGVLGMYGWREAGVDVGSDHTTTLSQPPVYAEQFAGAALEVPIVFDLGPRRSAEVSLVPFAGLGSGGVGLYRSGPWHGGPLFGGSLQIFAPRAYLGAALGAYFLPLPPPGRTGGHNDLGSYFFSLIVGLDAG